MTAYYNENDPFAAAWLRELVKVGHIAQGEVDERDIRDVRPDDLRRFVQCHFFAGIGVWSYALRQAGWPDERPAWTGSCPCQPFSTAGKRKGTADERHLWPSLFHLISQCRPPIFFGEQVASKDGLAWFDTVQADLEGEGYAQAAFDLCAAGFGAPHIRQRLYFVANAQRERTGRHTRTALSPESSLPSARHTDGQLSGHSSIVGSPTGELADSSDFRRDQRGNAPTTSLQGQRAERTGQHAEPEHAGQLQGRPEGLCGTSDVLVNSPSKQVGLSGCSRQQGRASGLDNTAGEGLPERAGQTDPGGQARSQLERSGYLRGFWRDADWIPCRDGRARPVEPGTFPLAHGAPNRVGRLRGYGNALVAPVAQAFIESYLEVTQGETNNEQASKY